MKTPWPTVRIDSVGNVQAGRQRSVHIVEGSPHPYLRVANVFDGHIDFTDVNNMLFTEKEFAIYSLQPGDILLNEGQSLELVGRSAIFEGPKNHFCFQNTLIRFRPHDAILSKYAQYVFQHYLITGIFASVASRTTSIAHLGVNRFASLQIALPPKEVQEAIAAILSTWDRGIRHLTGLIGFKLRSRESLVQRLMSGSLRFQKYATNVHEQVPLNQVLAKVSDSVVPSVSEMYREIGVRSHGRGVFHKDPVSGESLGNKRVYRVVPGCLTLNIVFAWERAVAITTDREDGMIASHRFPMFWPNPAHLLVEYALLYLLSKKGSEALELASPGGAGRNRTLSQTSFLKNLIPLPSVPEQRRIVSFVQTADREIDLLQKQLDALKLQKKGLLQKLLTGEVQVPLSQRGK